jgi:hypothetical protein
MGDTKISSKYLDDSKQGSVLNRRTYRIPATVTSTSAGISLSTNGANCTVHASVNSPTVVEAQVYIKTADGGTTPTISIGTNSTTYNNLVSAASTATAGVFLPASNAIGKLYLEADTTVYYKLGGTPTGGVIDVILTVYGIDTNTKA